MFESLLHPEATSRDLSIIGEAGGMEDVGTLRPVDRGLASEFGKGAMTGIRNLAQGTLATVGEVTGSETVQDAAEDMQTTTQQYRQSLKPAAGTLNKAVNTMGQFVEDVPGLALSFAGGFGGASLAAKLGSTALGIRRAAAIGSGAGLVASTFTRGFGNRKLELQDRGVEEPWAVVGALMSTAAEASLEKIGMEGVFGKLGAGRVFKRMSLAAAAGTEAGGLGATALSTVARALYNPTSYAKYTTRVGVALGAETMEEIATLFADAAIDGMMGAEGAGMPTGAELKDTVYNTMLRVLPIALTGGLLSGGRNDVAAKEIESRVTAPVTDETRAAAYTKAADQQGTPEEIALKARQNMAEMDAQMAAFESVMATRFTAADAKSTTGIIRTMSENLAALDERILPQDLLEDVKLAFESGQVDQQKWNEASALSDPEAQHTARVALVKEVLGDTYYDITDLAWARQKKTDNDRREVELFGDEKPEALAKRIAITTAFEQPTTRVLAQDVVDKETYKRIFARGSVAGVKAGGSTYTVVARGTYVDERGKTRLVLPGDLVFTQEAAKGKQKKAAKAGQVEMPTRLGETMRSVTLDRAAAMDGGEFYDSMKRMIADGVEMQDLDDARAEAMALVYPEEVAAERARIEAEDAAVLAQMEAEDAAFLKDELSRKGDRIKRFEERYAGVTVTSTTQVGQDTKTGKPHTIKDFDELARRLAPLEKKPVDVPTTPVMKRDAAGLADLARRTAIPENIIAALAKDVQVQMLSDEDYAQQVSTELLPRIQMQNAMRARAIETAGQRAQTAKLNAFAQEITDRELARETAVQGRTLRKSKRPKAKSEPGRGARAGAAAPVKAARQWTEAELKLVEDMAEGRFSVGETTPFAFYDPKTKIAHFFANAKSTDVVHELFHHMTMTGIMPSWHLEALKKNYGLDTPDGDEKAVEGFMRYLRTKELPEGSDPKLKDAFDHMRQVFAATMQPLAGQLNNETLAVFDTLFGFEPTGEVAEAAAALQARVLHTAEIEGGDSISKRAEAEPVESLPDESGRMSARPSGELFRAGMSPDDFEGRSPHVDWNVTDNYGAWTRKSVKEFAKAEHDFIYPSMLNKYDVTPKLAEEESAADIRRMSEAQVREAYSDEFLNEDPDDPNTDVDWREVRDRIAQEELSSWEDGGRQEMSTQFSKGFPPVVVRRTGEDSFVIEDGNHRVSVWQDADRIDVIPAWVVDDYLWKASEEDVRFSARAVTPEQDAEYLVAAEKGDTDTAQRLVDEAARKAGYTVGPVYHGGSFNQNIDPVFRVPEGPSRKNKWQLAFGVHFAETSTEAEAYIKKGGALQPSYLDGNMFDATSQELVSADDLARWPDSVRNRIEKFNKKWKNENTYAFQVAQALDEMPPSKASEAVIAAGYAGVKYQARANIDNRVFRPFDAYVVVGDPNQIKSADPVTRDDAGNVIPLSERFDSGRDDIRFSARPLSEAPADDDKAYSKSRKSLIAHHIARMQIPAADAVAHLRALAVQKYPHVAQGDPERTLRLLSKEEWQEFYKDVRKAQDTERAARLDRRAIAEFGGSMATLSPAERTLVASIDYAKTQSLFKRPSLRNPTKEAIEAVATDLASKMEQEVELKENARMASVPAYHGSEGAGTVQNLLRSFWHSAKKFRRGVFNRVLLQTRDIQTLALLLADNNPDSTFMQLSADIRESDNRKVAQTAKSLGYIEEAMKKRGVDSFAKHTARPVVVAGQAMSMEEALAIAMLARGDTSRNQNGEYSYRQAEALFASNGKDYVGEGGRDAFDAFVTDAWKVVNADKNIKATMEVMDEYFEKIKADINASRAERGEEPMGDQSGYFPMIREGGMFANEDSFAATLGISPGTLDPKVPVGARTRERGQAYGGRIRLNVETVFNEYRRQADQYIAKETTVQMWKAALNQARTTFADKGLTDELEMVYSHLESERHYTGRYTPLSADEIVVRAVSSKYKQSIFGLNIPSAMMQPMGALNVNSVLPIMDAWRAPLNVMDMMRHAVFNIGRNFPNVLKGNRYWDMMVAGNSKHSASEFTAIETGIQKGAAGYFDPTIKGVPLKDVLLLPMRHGDMIGRAAAWGAAYESQMRQMRNMPSLTEKQKHDKAFKFAEDAVEETQAAGMMSGRTWMQKSNEYLKAIVPFTSQQSKDWNILSTRLLNPMQKAWKAGAARGGTMSALNEVWEVVAGTEHAKREYGIHRGAGQVLAFSYVVPAMMMAALSRGRPPEDFEEFLADLLAYNVAIVPIIGPAIRTAIVMDRFFDQQPIYFKLVNETAKIVKAAKDKDGEEFTWAAVRTAAMASGLPLKAVKVFEKGMKGQFTDQYDELDMKKVMTYSLLGQEALMEVEAEEKAGAQ